jgi:hypothetical protein
LELLDRLFNGSLAVMLTCEEALEHGGFHTWVHLCPVLPDGAAPIGLERTLGSDILQFCPFCGQRFGPKKPLTEDWISTEILLKMCSRWLGVDGAVLADWLGAEPRRRRELVVSAGPLLAYLAERLESAARRFCRRQEARWRDARARLRAAHQTSQLIADTLASITARNSVEPDPLTQGFVYAISNGRQIKIGWSKHHPASSRSRIKGLQVASPRRLIVVGAFMGSMRDEARTMGLFVAHHVLGEWFRDVPEIRAYFSSRAFQDRQGTNAPPQSFFFACG